MQKNFINKYEYIQNDLQEQKTKKAFSLAIISSIIFLALFLLEPLLFGYLFNTLFKYYPALDNEVFRCSANIIISALTIFIPFLILAKKAKIRFLDSFKVNPEVPKKFWFYIPFTIGVGFFIGAVLSILFKDNLFKRFYEIEGRLPVTTAGIILTYISVAFIPAIFEEWAFRGVLLRSLKPYGKVFALVVSSVIFGCMHISPPRIIFATVFGLLVGFIYIKTSSIWYGALIHLVNNTISVTTGYAAYFKGEESTEIIIISLIIWGLIICGIVGFIHFKNKGYFHTRTMHHITPPDKPKLLNSQYASITFFNGYTILFVLFYFATLIVQFYID